MPIQKIQEERNLVNCLFLLLLLFPCLAELPMWHDWRKWRNDVFPIDCEIKWPNHPPLSLLINADERGAEVYGRGSEPARLVRLFCRSVFLIGRRPLFLSFYSFVAPLLNGIR